MMSRSYLGILKYIMDSTKKYLRHFSEIRNKYPTINKSLRSFNKDEFILIHFILCKNI